MEKVESYANYDPDARSDEAVGIFKLPETQHEDAKRAAKVTSGSNMEPVNKWMAFANKSTTKGPSVDNKNNSSNNIMKDYNELRNHLGVQLSSDQQVLTEATIAERTAEWGLAVNTGNFKAAAAAGKASSSFDGDRSKSLSDRFVESTRTSGDSNFGSESSISGVFPRVSQELKEALATLQQTFVVSDATKPDIPIMYASSGFFTMTGYSSKEIIGRNW